MVSDFFSEKGYVIIIAMVSYVLKLSSAAWRVKLSETLKAMGCKSIEADPDLWLKHSTESNSFEYNKYVLVYVYEI